MKNKHIGRVGEDYVAQRLTAEGAMILSRNYTSPYGEIDLIALQDDVLCFIEVKTRKPNSQVSGEKAVSFSKQRRILSTALLYLQDHPKDCSLRFDVAVVLHDGQGEIEGWRYYPAAFDGSAYES